MKKPPFRQSSEQIRLAGKLPKFDHRDLINSSFWVGQIFMLIATVLGVYLAAQTGLQQALEFDDITDKQNLFFMERSLYAELEANANTLEHYAHEIKQKNPYQLTNLHPELQSFVWENMKYSPKTLEVPSQFINQASHFYSEIRRLIKRAEQRQIGASYASEQILGLVNALRSTTLPGIKKHYQKIKQNFIDLGYTQLIDDMK